MRARRVASEPSSVIVQVRVTPKERDAFQALAKYRRRGLGDLIRILLEDDLVRAQAERAALPVVVPARKVKKRRAK